MKSTLARALPLAAAVLACALVVGACGGKTDRLTPASTQTLRLALDWRPNAVHAGLYAAIADGDFRRAGLAVKPLVPSDPSQPLKQLADGEVDFAISYEPELLRARATGRQLVAVAAIVQRPLASLISLGDKGPRRPAQLLHQKVGTPGLPFQSGLLDEILARADVPAAGVHETDLGYGLVPALLSKRVDATFGGFSTTEGVALRQGGKKPNVIGVGRLGVPDYDELVLVARRDELAARGRAVRSFVQALGRGYERVRRDPSAGIRPLLRANPHLDSKLARASLRATMGSFFPKGDGRPWGWMDPRRWQAFGDWMQRKDLVKRPPHGGTAVTNEFLAGQGA